jgi:thiosulfate/3-mercaptopyruvate sulfurtransferase
LERIANPLDELVDFSWIDQNKDNPELSIVDSRPPIKYLQGHIPGAANLPATRLFDRGTLELLPIEKLTAIVGDAGITEDRSVLICDDPDGQNEAMLAWTLELVGHPRVKLLSSFMPLWTRQNRPISYRPARTEPKEMRLNLNANVRATRNDISKGRGMKLVDLRSRDEFEGKSSDGPSSRHLPGAVNLPWTNLTGQGDQLFGARSHLEMLVSEIGLCRDDQIVTYCSYGPRAALGFAALQQLGFKNVKVYDRAFQQWTTRTELTLDACVGLS